MQESGSIKSASPAKPFYILNTIAERILSTHPETRGRRNWGAKGHCPPPRISQIELCGAFKMCLIQSNSYSTCTSRLLYLPPALETSRQLKWRIRFKNTVLLKVIDHRHHSPYRCSFHFAIANTVHTMAFLGNFFQ